jgi:hypothetical protein
MATLNPKIAIEVLKANVAAAKKIREQILIANAAKDRKGLSEGASLLNKLLANTVDVLKKC